MIVEDIFQTVLVNPAKHQNANRLFIVSGYASVAMAFHHLEKLEQSDLENQVEISLIYGAELILVLRGV